MTHGVLVSIMNYKPCIIPPNSRLPTKEGGGDGRVGENIKNMNKKNLFEVVFNNVMHNARDTHPYA